MKRRSFLSLIGAATVAPALPSMGSSAAVQTAVGYNRYMYGLGVFQARTRAGLTTADLMARLHLTPAQASAMMREMTARGVFAQTIGAARVAVQNPIPRKPYVRRALREFQDALEDQASANSAPLAPEKRSDEAIESRSMADTPPKADQG